MHSFLARAGASREPGCIEWAITEYGVIGDERCRIKGLHTVPLRMLEISMHS